MHLQLCKHIEDFDLLAHCQSGFRTAHSTETTLTHIADDALRLFDQNDPCLLIHLDLSSAFDTVKHANMINFLEKRMGLSGPTLNWFVSFLHNRTERIKVNQTLLGITPVSIRVSKGSTLSPTLFSLFMEPLTEILKHSNIHSDMYADNTQLYFRIS